MNRPTCKRCKKSGLPSLITDTPGRFNVHCVDCERKIEKEEEAYWNDYERIESEFHTDYWKEKENDG